MRHLVAVFAGFLALSPGFASAERYDASPGDDVETMIRMLLPGDELVLAGGMYETTQRFSIEVSGTEEQPIIIRAADGETPHIRRPNASENLIDIVDSRWLVFRGIEFSGGSAGLRFIVASDITIEDCAIHDTADVALRMNDRDSRYERMIIRRNHIYDTNGTGEGMYLGCNNNACQLANSVIEQNYVHHTNNPETITQGDGIEIKEGSFGNVIRDNVIHDTNYPCILTYSAVGNGEPNIVERNVMWNCGDHGIQSSADAVIRNNIILSAAGSGIAAQPHQSGAPANMTIVHNTVINAGGDALSIRNPTGSVVIANNALYSSRGRALFMGGDMSMVTVEANFGMGTGVSEASLGDFVRADFGGAPPMDVFLADGALVGAGSATYVTEVDFNGTRRSGADIGAYAFAAGGNPGWVISAAFKESAPAARPPTDGGVTDGGAGDPPVDEDAGAGDAGRPVDAGTGGTPDATLSDAGHSFDGGDGEGGGGCTVGASGAPLLWVLAAFIAIRTRK
ncbi:MAG: right-handed parallel beta-helix repeat-containing protein [Myxococcota bacterium]